MRIAESARRHGIPDEDIEHAVRNTIVVFKTNITMILGAARNGDILEVGFLDYDTTPVVIHAMQMQTKYIRHLPKE